jgi:hypothetical protein
MKDFFEILIGLILLIILNKYSYAFPVYCENKERQLFLNKLKLNKCDDKEIVKALKRYYIYVDVIIKKYAFRGSYESDLFKFQDEILNLMKKSDLNNEDKQYIENIFSKKLRNISMFPFFTSQEQLNREFLWKSKNN